MPTSIFLPFKKPNNSSSSPTTTFDASALIGQIEEIKDAIKSVEVQAAPKVNTAAEIDLGEGEDDLNSTRNVTVVEDTEGGVKKTTTVS